MLHRFHQKKILIMGVFYTIATIFLLVRCLYVCVGHSAYLTKRALDNQQRERVIKAARGRILDRNGIVLADNRSVCTISVIHNQMKEPEKIIESLSKILGIPREKVEKRVMKYSSIEKIKSNVPREIGAKIRKLHLAGVKVDEDYKRYYPYGSLASKVLGFTGADNQGILGIEAMYDDVMTGQNGVIYTMTDLRGIEVEGQSETRKEPVKGNDLVVSLDYHIQMYATQLADATLQKKHAKSVSILVMDVESGEILSMVNAPEYDLNDPYGNVESMDADALNQMWRNGCINDSYEPGSTFKIITAAAALEEGVVDSNSRFYCPGYIVVGDRRIRCSKTQGHGSQDFTLATMNSCNPAFIMLGARLGVERFCFYFDRFGLNQKTGIDLAGEARTIMHKKENMKEVELATCSFGQSFQVSPIRFLTSASALVGNGKLVTPHVGKAIVSSDTEQVQPLTYQTGEQIVTKETTQKLREILEQVVANGTGKNAYVEGFRIGGKTATSQTIPRGNGVYIASFLGFAPADDPKVIALVIIKEPKGMYYGGQVAAPVMKQLFENILPYLGVIRYNSES